MTNQFKRRFEVEAIFPYKDGFAISGRCTANSIKIGDAFAMASKLLPEQSAGRAFSMRMEVIGEINLVVNEIQYFDKSILELQTGHSGGLYVLGIGGELLGPGCVIESSDKGAED